VAPASHDRGIVSRSTYTFSLIRVFRSLAGQNAAVVTAVQASLRESESLRLAAESAALLERGDSGAVPVLLALRALQTTYTPQADIALLRALDRPVARVRFDGHTDRVRAVAIAADGHLIATGANDGTPLGCR
jgi:hypothetical protein